MKKFLLPLAFAAALLAVHVAQAAPVTFTAALSGASESPAVASAGTGFATVIFDSVSHTLSVTVNFSGLTGTTTASHIHCCTAVPNAGTVGVATETPSFGGFPLGVHSGSYFSSFDTTLAASYNPAFVTGHGGTVASAEAALFAGMMLGESYLNIHTSFAPAGEIRGFLVQEQAQSVPEPGSLALLALGMIGVAYASKGKSKGAGTVASLS